MRGATSDCFTCAAERWGGAYLFSNVSSYALETGQLGRNGSIRNAGGRACFFKEEVYSCRELYHLFYEAKSRWRLLTMYDWVSVATSRMVYHVCIRSLVKAMRVHEYLMEGMHQWFVLLPPVITRLSHWIFHWRRGTSFFIVCCDSADWIIFSVLPPGLSRHQYHHVVLCTYRAVLSTGVCVDVENIFINNKLICVWTKNTH